MPNIEIHGVLTGSSTLGAEGLRKRIFALFLKKPYIVDMVVTILQSKVTDQGGDYQPFLRLVGMSSDPLEEIIEILKSLEMDIEVLLLESFHTKE